MDDDIRADIRAVRDFLSDEVENREAAGDSEYLHVARVALFRFDRIVRGLPASPTIPLATLDQVQGKGE